VEGDIPIRVGTTIYNYWKAFQVLKQKSKLAAILALTPIVAVLETSSITVFFVLVGSLLSELQGVGQSQLFERLLQALPVISDLSYKSQFVSLLALTMTLFVLKGISSHLLQSRANKYLLNQSYEQSSRAISRLLRSNLETIEGKRGQAIIHATTTGIETIYQSILSNAIQIFTEVIFLLFAIVALSLFAPSVVVLLALFTILLIIRNIKLGRIYRELGIEVREKNIVAKSQIIEGLNLFKEAFVLGRQEYLARGPNSLREQITETNDYLFRLQSLNRQVLDVFLLFGVCSVLGIQVATGTLASTVTLTITLGLVMTRIAPSLVRVNNLILSIKSQHASALTSLELLEQLNQSAEAKIKSDTSPYPVGSGSKNLIICDFYNRLNSSKELQSINIELPSGALLAVLGRSGTGKTTFLEQILGLRNNVSGSVMLGGVNIVQVIETSPGLVSYVPQVPIIMDAPLIENILFGSAFDELKMESVLNVVFGNDKFAIQEISSKPLGENGRFLSGGERQRIGIARAIYSHPELLIIDEGTSALDTISEKQILSNLKEHLDNPITILSTHRINSIINADAVVFFESVGTFVYGSIDQVRAQSSTFNELLEDVRNFK